MAQKTLLELDVRELPATQRPHAAVNTFDGLEPGQSLVIIAEREPKTVLFTLQEKRQDAFDWSVLEESPGRYRVEVRRRTNAGPRTVQEYLSWDHRRLDGLLTETRRLVERGAMPAAAARFAEYWCGFGRHAEMEEQILLPAFERVAGVGGSPLTSLYAEHETLHRLAGGVAELLAGVDVGAALGALESLREVMLLHGLKEERVLYPVSDKLAGGDREREDLVRWMQAL